jgi:hypothetical protein
MLPIWRKAINSAIGATLFMTVSTIQSGCSRSSAEGASAGALIGGGIGAVLGGSRGAALGALSGGMIGGLFGHGVNEQKQEQFAALNLKRTYLASLESQNDYLQQEIELKRMHLAQYEMEVQNLKWHVANRSKDAQIAGEMLSSIRYNIREAINKSVATREDFENRIFSKRHMIADGSKLYEINRTHNLLIWHEDFLNRAYSILW